MKNRFSTLKWQRAKYQIMQRKKTQFLSISSNKINQVVAFSTLLGSVGTLIKGGVWSSSKAKKRDGPSAKRI